VHPDSVLVKTSTDNSRWQTERDAQTIEVLGAYTLLSIPPGAKRPPRMASAFLGKYAVVM